MLAHRTRAQRRRGRGGEPQTASTRHREKTPEGIFETLRKPPTASPRDADRQPPGERTPLVHRPGDVERRRGARDVARAPGRPVFARRTLEKNPSRDIDRCSRCRVAAAPKHPRWGSANSVAREDARRTYPVRRHVSGLLWTTCCRACRRGRVSGFFIPFVVSPSLHKIGILGFSRVFVWESVSKFTKFTKP